MDAFGRWLAELKRRKVFRVGVIYGAIALAVADGADSLLAPLGAPSWVQTVVAALAIAGFPVALLLAWLYELTPTGIRRTTDGEGGPAARRAGWSTFLEAALLLAVLAGGVWLLGFARSDAARAASADPGASPPADAASLLTLAVVPFENLSRDPENRYFVDGLAVQLLDELARVDALQVKARSSSFAFRDSALTVREIGRRLGVGSILEGSVRWSGESMRIRVALTDVTTGFDLWSETFSEARTDLFAIQDAIAREIVRQLTGRLLPADSAALDVARTRSRQAYDSYLQGIDRLRLRVPTALREAREHFEGAISIDPNYAKPYAGLAEAYYHLSTHDAAAPREEYANRAKEYGRRALALDPLSADAHAVLGAIAYQVDLRFEAAERELREAIRLNPNSATAHLWLGETLLVRGHFEDAAEAFRRAAVLDPLSPMPLLLDGFREVVAGDPASGLAEWAALSDRFPEFYWGEIDTALTLLAMGDREGALEAWTSGSRLYHSDDPDAAERLARGMDWLVRADRDPGQRAGAIRYWRELPAEVTLEHWRLLAFYRLDTELALDVLRDLRDRRDPLFAYAGLDLVWADPDQDIPRLADFLEASGIRRFPMEMYTRLQP